MSENLLGKVTPVVTEYAPQLLHPVARAAARDALSIDTGTLPFVGEDLWHAWELSWLDGNRLPQVAVARFRIPCESPNLVESKSFKLYLNSLNFSEFDDWTALAGVLVRDLGVAVDSTVRVRLIPLDSAALLPSALPGVCVDRQRVEYAAVAPDPALLQARPGRGGTWHSHLLRSLCPVTGQPDWGSLVIACVGADLDEASLLRYILSYREHRAFHEHCVERIFRDLMSVASPGSLSVQALYSRRGGLDINPWRSSDQPESPSLRSARQ